MSTWGNNKPDRKREAGNGGSGWLRSPQGYRVVHFNVEQLWQNLIRQGWERVPPKWLLVPPTTQAATTF